MFFMTFYNEIYSHFYLSINLEAATPDSATGEETSKKGDAAGKEKSASSSFQVQI